MRIRVFSCFSQNHLPQVRDRRLRIALVLSFRAELTKFRVPKKALSPRGINYFRPLSNEAGPPFEGCVPIPNRPTTPKGMFRRKFQFLNT